MNIHPTKEVLTYLLDKFPHERPIIKIVYDTDGCGCAVNGVVQLWHMNGISTEDTVGYDREILIVYEARQEVFFEEELKLGYNPRERTFVLKSNSQIYHASLSLIDKTEAHLDVK